MRLKWAALALGAALAAPVGCGGQGPAEEVLSGPNPALDCAYPLVWDGVSYEAGVDLPASARLGPALGPGVVLGCGDEETGYPDENVEVHGLDGIHPSVAVAALLESADRPIVWLGDGYLVESLRHPLQAAIETWTGESVLDGFTCGASLTTTARALSTPGPGEPLEVEADDPEVEALLTAPGTHRLVSIEADTRIAGLDRHGVPYVGRGDELVLALRPCDGNKDEPGLTGIRLLVADSLTGSS